MSTVHTIAFVIELVVVLVFLLSMGGILTWVERKESALLQDRIGANRAGFVIPRGPLVILNPILRFVQKLGLLHALADGLKMFTKEPYTPAGANKFMFFLAPFLGLMPALITMMVVPFGPDIMVAGELIPLQVVRIDAGMLYIFAFSGLGVYAAAIGGWSSGNKYALLGSIRASAQMVSYEISMGLSLIGLFMVFESLQLNQIVEAQGDLLWGWLPAWGIVIQPFAFFLFFTAIMAETKRAPFDAPEGESEIVAGYFLEYSGMQFGAFFLGEFVEIAVAASIITTLFLGGWQVPYLTETGFILPGGLSLALSGGVIVALQVLSFLVKVLFMCWFQVLLRWSLPRFRFDQIMTLGWKFLLPLALLNIFITGIVLLIIGN